MRDPGRKKHGAARCLGLCASYLLAAAAAGLGWLYSSLPDHVSLEPGQPLELPRFAWVEPLSASGSRNVASTRTAGSYQATFAIGGVFPVKRVQAVVTPRPSVTVSGAPFGVKMFSEGALIVGFTDTAGPDGAPRNPAKEAGLRLGDRVVRIGETATENNDAVRAALDAAAGRPVQVVYIRDDCQQQTTLTPCWDAAAGSWRAGMWVRDSSAGVGTLTFIDEGIGVFAGLGHSISDGDTGQSIALRSGEIVPCEIVGCTAGAVGAPGELKGRFIGSQAAGAIELNGENGVYGSTRTDLFAGQAMEVAFAQEVVEGPAQILTTTAGQQPRLYDVEIEKVTDAEAVRNMVVHVTDPDLLAETGGIVQGMSGSPILQNGRLAGAVTHVLVNDPTRGYAIFAETMLAQAETLAPGK